MMMETIGVSDGKIVAATLYLRAGRDETIVEAASAAQAANAAVTAHAAAHGGGTYTVTVSEATDYDLPLIAGDDYTITVD